MPKIKHRQHRRKCTFCENKTSPYYRDVDSLSSYISERRRILPAIYTGACSKHQRQVSQSIKQARFIALLPYTTTV